MTSINKEFLCRERLLDVRVPCRLFCSLFQKLPLQAVVAADSFNLDSRSVDGKISVFITNETVVFSSQSLLL